jgi:hypothetical protein
VWRPSVGSWVWRGVARSTVHNHRGERHGLVFGTRIRIGANETVNLSKGAASVATRVGQVTVNSRSRGSIRILLGLSFRFGRRW